MLVPFGSQLSQLLSHVFVNVHLNSSPYWRTAALTILIFLQSNLRDLHCSRDKNVRKNY